MLHHINHWAALVPSEAWAALAMFLAFLLAGALAAGAALGVDRPPRPRRRRRRLR